MEQLGKEIEIILACSRRIGTAELHSVLGSLVSETTDWDYIFQVSYRNAVFPLVFTNLLKAAANVLPPAVHADISARLRRHVEANMFLTSQMFRIKSLLDSADIPSLPFKGPLLAVQAFGDPSSRMYGDLDVLIQPKHLSDAVSILMKAGFQPVTSVSWLKKSNSYISGKKDVGFIDGNGQTILELHWKLSGSHFGLPKEMNRLWNRLEFVELAGARIPSLSFNDLFIYLCLHGSRHSWERLGWICDVYHLLSSRESIDWAAIAAEARSLGCENVVLLGLKLINELFDYDVPEPFRTSMNDNPVYEMIISEIRGRIFSAEATQVQLGDRYAYHLKLKERRMDRWKLHLHYISWYSRLIIKPNQVDRDVLRLPRLLYPVYFITRPVRLMYNYLNRPDHRSKAQQRANEPNGSVVA